MNSMTNTVLKLAKSLKRTRTYFVTLVLALLNENDERNGYN